MKFEKFYSELKNNGFEIRGGECYLVNGHPKFWASEGVKMRIDSIYFVKNGTNLGIGGVHTLLINPNGKKEEPILRIARDAVPISAKSLCENIARDNNIPITYYSGYIIKFYPFKTTEGLHLIDSSILTPPELKLYKEYLKEAGFDDTDY